MGPGRDGSLDPWIFSKTSINDISGVFFIFAIDKTALRNGLNDFKLTYHLPKDLILCQPVYANLV